MFHGITRRPNDHHRHHQEEDEDADDHEDSEMLEQAPPLSREPPPPPVAMTRHERACLETAFAVLVLKSHYEQKRLEEQQKQQLLLQRAQQHLWMAASQTNNSDGNHPTMPPLAPGPALLHHSNDPSTHSSDPLSIRERRDTNELQHLIHMTDKAMQQNMAPPYQVSPGLVQHLGRGYQRMILQHYQQHSRATAAEGETTNSSSRVIAQLENFLCQIFRSHAKEAAALWTEILSFTAEASYDYAQKYDDEEEDGARTLAVWVWRILDAIWPIPLRRPWINPDDVPSEDHSMSRIPNASTTGKRLRLLSSDQAVYFLPVCRLILQHYGPEQAQNDHDRDLASDFLQFIQSLTGAPAFSDMGALWWLHEYVRSLP